MNRRSEIDWVRSVSICSVVLLHSSSLFVSRYSRLTLFGVAPALLCNQATRFCVPVFFMLSGLGLCISKRLLKLPDFWLYRFRRIGLPYILWTCFYFLLDRNFDFKCLLSVSSLNDLGKLLVTGGAASHLWYIPVLLQLNLLFPALKCLLKRFPVLTLFSSFLLSMFCTLILYIPFPITGWWRPYLWRLFPTWVFYFSLGIILPEKPAEHIRAFIQHRRYVLVFVAVILALIYSWDAGRSGNLDSIKPQLFIYSPLCFLLLEASWAGFERVPALGLLSSFIARHSMTIYFSHIYFLRLLRKISFFNQNLLTMLLTFTVVMVLSALTAVLADASKYVVKRWKTKFLREPK